MCMKESKWSATHFRAVSLLLLIGALSYDSFAAPGDVDLSFDPDTLGINGRMSAVVVQPDGKLLVGGYFPSVRGLLRTNVARLNTDGSGPDVQSERKKRRGCFSRVAIGWQGGRRGLFQHLCV